MAGGSMLGGSTLAGSTLGVGLRPCSNAHRWAAARSESGCPMLFVPTTVSPNSATSADQVVILVRTVSRPRSGVSPASTNTWR